MGEKTDETEEIEEVLGPDCAAWLGGNRLDKGSRRPGPKPRSVKL